MDDSQARASQVAPRHGGGAIANLSFRTRLTAAMLVAAVVPVLGFGLLVVLFDITFLPQETRGLADILFFALLAVVLLCIPLAILLSGALLGPLRAVARSLDRVSAGELSESAVVPGDDELARLAESHNRLAADLRRRSTQVGRILDSIGDMSPGDDVDRLAERAGADAARAFDLIDASVYLGNVIAAPDPEVIPGEPRPLRALLRVGDEALGVLLGWLPATRPWSGADQDLFDLYASEVAVALRNAQLFARVGEQNERLMRLDEAKDDFLRGVTHNLQSPLTSIRAHVEQLSRDHPDRRLEIIGEQSERLSRIVRQLLIVARLESGAIKPLNEVINLAARTRKAWEALAAADVALRLDDRSNGWLAIADADQLDQVLWALLDNAVKYGNGDAVDVVIAPEPGESRLKLTITDMGPGVSMADRAMLFGRFVRGDTGSSEGGSGLGLYVSRELCRAMGGDLELEASRRGHGASFSVLLPAERAEEG
jgi:signal transduction histidine kinase/HAMP domain-containing protein